MEPESDIDRPTVSPSSPNVVPYAYILCHVLHLSASFACVYRDQAIQVLEPYSDQVVVTLSILGECFWGYAIIQIFRKQRRGPLLFWWSDLAATTTIEFFLMTMYM